MKLLVTLTAIGAASMLASGSTVWAQDADPVIEMSTIDCRTMLKMDAEERDFTLIYFHGFISGRKAETLFNGPMLREATSKVMDYCIDSPSASMMEAFERSR